MNITKMNEKVSRFGLLATIRYYLYILMSSSFQYTCYKGMTLVLVDVEDQYLTVPEGMTGGFLDENVLRELAKEPSYDLDDQFLDEALRKNDQCYGLIEDGKLAAYGWYAPESSRINEESILHFDSCWIYMYKGYTHPDYRGRRLHAIGMALALKDYTECGKAGLISLVQVSNYASLRSIKRLGYRIIGNVGKYGFFGRRVDFSDNGCRAHGLRISSLPAPVRSPRSASGAPAM